MKLAAATFATFLAVALADDNYNNKPTKDVPKGTETCDQTGTTHSGQYDLTQNMWGANKAPNPIQCMTGTEDGFKVRWSYGGSEQEVKAYPNIQASVSKGKLMQDIVSINTTAKWSYNDTKDLSADVAYDMFTSENKDHDNWSGDFEFMVWLGKYGTISPVGDKVEPGATVPGVDGQWDFWSGDVTVPSGKQHTFSFVATEEKKDWTGDIKPFVQYAADKKGFPINKQFLINLQFGTEPFKGENVELTVEKWTAEIK